MGKLVFDAYVQEWPHLGQEWPHLGQEWAMRLWLQARRVVVAWGSSLRNIVTGSGVRS